MKKRIVVAVALSEELTAKIHEIVDSDEVGVCQHRLYDSMMDEIQGTIVQTLCDCYPEHGFGDEVYEDIAFADRHEAERMWNTYEISMEDSK